MLIFWRLDIFGVVGVGWGNNVLFDFYSIASALALPHIRHAMLLDVLLRFHTYTLCCWMFSCASTHTRYAAGCSLALPHIRHARLLAFLLHFSCNVLNNLGQLCA